MANYAPAFGLDKNTNAYKGAPVTSVVARYTSENAIASSVITLTHDTTMLEIATLGTGAAMRWVRTGDTEASLVTAVSGANFNHIVPPNTVRTFVIPKESIGSSGASVQGANRGEGLFQRVAIKTTATAASVFLAEYGSGGY